MQQVIIDCDPGIDDALALEYAIKSGKLNVLAICVVAGNVLVEIGAENTFKVLERCHRLDIPVYLGAEKPLHRPFVSAQDTHGIDGLGESHLSRQSNTQPQEKKASDFLADFFSKKQPVGILALGPLTNIALALTKNTELGNNIARFVSMGGTYKSHGNCSPVAEFNYWCDPDAAAQVFTSLGGMIEMVGLDVTRKIVFSPTILEYCRWINPSTYEYLKKITRFYFNFHWEYEHLLGCVINDPLAVAYYISPEICTGFKSYVAVETQGISVGQTLVDRYDFWHEKANSKILNDVNTKEFFIQFLTVLLDAPETVITTDLNQLGLG
ncbi:nucleoside hydrolase [Melissococcus plutonius]|uniref:PreQ1-regulated inosine-uridine nucleosidehydrolase n=1 Tax=Melissococcus plutonius (strain ATCC 35311 / DSM 29964 / CIP 104052 / LMG 20360 / NCIMB 702443) TaxID=940190 RepID=F3YAQ0_MELPT|nr:nucleoside hydrolase [Melissococcus plutonius]KMT32378.1 pyrimidine-specific ribonucleoside hydrolase RihA [Melissococcus plutonius]KMT34950.1 pyrimidine-specific ribonucleoside hydrolase RihA [Melissococcus plutonius]KMT39884.1 pyrimidine-specific ribonucleoside hydrolase RihA [Melissococcus plutonius]MBB5178387.1 purine nucleosidase [Melissococcus plutonius]BAK21578.1 preQ1-regulated inosine-uridine nucleosidehydrolase [Melissococcus plutonius ATCC 35311]